MSSKQIIGVDNESYILFGFLKNETCNAIGEHTHGTGKYLVYDKIKAFDQEQYIQFVLCERHFLKYVKEGQK